MLTVDDVFALADLALDVWGAGFGQVIRSKIIFAAASAMRPAEQWALQWAKVKLASEEIDVLWQYEPVGADRLPRVIRELRHDGKDVREAPGGILVRPKNDCTRTIVLLDEATRALSMLPSHLASDHVFLTQRGKLFTKSN